MITKEPHSNLSANLQHLMQNHKIKSVELAEALGVSAELIGKLKNGVLNNPTLKVLTGLSFYFNLTIQDLVFANLATIKNSEIKILNYLPLVEWETIKDWKENKSGKTVILENSFNSSFAVNLNENYGIFSKGSLIFISTETPPQNNDYVLVLSKQQDKFYIRKLIVEEHSYLQSIMPEINNVIEYDAANYLIYGTVVGYQKLVFFKG